MTNIDINDCWNKIGVWRKSNETCPLLSQYVHCRNCKTYIDSGLNLLDRELPDTYTDENTQIFNVSKQEQVSEQTSCLIFRLGDEWHAIKTNILNEICEMSEIHSIPHNNVNILDGLVNIHGEMEICISLAQLMIKQKPINTDSKIKSRIVLIKLDSGKYAFKACEILGIYPINIGELGNPPSSISNADQQLTEAVFTYNSQSVGLIDTNYLNMSLLEAIS